MEADIVRAYENKNVAYFFSKDGILKTVAYSQGVVWGSFIILYIIIELLFSVGGVQLSEATYIFGLFVAVFFTSFIAPICKDLINSKSFEELKSRQGVEKISWKAHSKGQNKWK
jgi:hypothetical protein